MDRPDLSSTAHSRLFFYLQFRATETEGYTAVEINLSGRQRMLTQRILLLRSLLTSSPEVQEAATLDRELDTAIAEMRWNHARLEHPNISPGPGGDQPGAVRKLFFSGAFSLDRRVHEFLATAEAFRGRDTVVVAGVEYGRAEWVNLINRGDLLSRLDGVVKAYEEVSEAAISEIRWVQIGLFGLVALLILFSPFSSGSIWTGVGGSGITTACWSSWSSRFPIR